MTTAAVLYPHAWNVWRVALSGVYKSDPGSQALHLDTLSRVNAWLEHWAHDVGPFIATTDSVRVQIDPPKSSPVLRREQLDVIPMLPAGDYHEVTVLWFYNGDQKAIAWPHDDNAMLLAVYPPDSTTAAPQGLLQAAADTVGKGLNKAQTAALVIGGAALLLALAVYVGSRAARKPRGYVVVEPDQEPVL